MNKFFDNYSRFGIHNILPYDKKKQLRPDKIPKLVGVFICVMLLINQIIP